MSNNVIIKKTQNDSFLQLIKINSPAALNLFDQYPIVSVRDKVNGWRDMRVDIIQVSILSNEYVLAEIVEFKEELKSRTVNNEKNI